jgi:hypothetical protein
MEKKRLIEKACACVDNEFSYYFFDDFIYRRLMIGYFHFLIVSF